MRKTLKSCADQGRRKFSMGASPFFLSAYLSRKMGRRQREEKIPCTGIKIKRRNQYLAPPLAALQQSIRRAPDNPCSPCPRRHRTCLIRRVERRLLPIALRQVGIGEERHAEGDEIGLAAADRRLRRLRVEAAIDDVAAVEGSL